MDRGTYLRRWSELHGGADASSALVRGWLSAVHALATPLARLRVPPDVVTALGLLVAASAPVLAAAGGAGVVAASAVVALSALVDSLDGAVAVLTGRVTRWGAVLDGVADRISDAAFVGVLWVLGGPAGVCAAAVALSWLQEYARARAGAAGMSEMGVLTIDERPTRVAVVAMFALAAATRPDGPWPTVGAWLLVGLGLVGLVQLLVVVRRTLADDPAGLRPGDGHGR
jgi:CDP-diacylglycerol--glycerol-3-phosphate 3-phosphatidyltransferase